MPAERIREYKVPVTQVKDQIDAVCELLSYKSLRFPAIAIFDYDFTLKTDYLTALLSVKFGVVPRESIQILQMLSLADWHVCILTNQHPKGQIIARQISNMRGSYPFFPDSLDKAMRRQDPKEKLIFGNESTLYLPFYKFKKTKDALFRLCNFINNHKEHAQNGIYMIGDRQTDIKFAQRLNNEISTNGLCVNSFLKLPNPPYFSLFPDFISNITP